MALLCLALAGWLGASGSGFVFEHGRLVVQSTAKELRDSRKELTNVSSGHVPSDMNGGVVFDATVVQKLPDDNYGQAVWLVEPTKIYLGSSQLHSELVNLTSPTLENGGIVLAVGERIRAFTVQLDGRFYIWNETVLELSENAK